MTLCRAQRRGNSHIGPTIILWLEPVRPWQGHNRRVGVASGGSTNGRRAGAEPGHDRPMATSRRRLAHCQRRDDLLGQSNGPPEGRAWGQANYNFFFQEIFWELEKLRGIETVWSAGCFFSQVSVNANNGPAESNNEKTDDAIWMACVIGQNLGKMLCTRTTFFFWVQQLRLTQMHNSRSSATGTNNHRLEVCDFIFFFVCVLLLLLLRARNPRNGRRFEWNFGWVVLRYLIGRRLLRAVLSSYLT